LLVQFMKGKQVWNHRNGVQVDELAKASESVPITEESSADKTWLSFRHKLRDRLQQGRASSPRKHLVAGEGRGASRALF
jgi:hypothetical protein